MTTGDDDPPPPDAEHYLDLSDVEDEQGGPHFDVVLRGYDRRQVDDHVAGLRRMVAQLKAQLAVRQRRSGAASTAGIVPEARSPADVAPASEPGATDAIDTLDAAERRDPDMVGAFNDRLRGILQAAEQEAQMVRSRAAESLLAEHAESRAALADLRAQRDAVFDDLVRLRGWLDELVTTAGRPGSPPPAMPAPASPAPPGPWRPRAPAPGPSAGYGPHPRPQPRQRPTPPSPPSHPEGVDRGIGPDRERGAATGATAATATPDSGETGTRPMAADPGVGTEEADAVPDERSRG